MPRALANVGSIAVACLAWAALAALFLDAAGLDPLGLRAQAVPPVPPRPNELCGLATPLGQGFDRHCDFTAQLVPGADALEVRLDQTWEGTTLVQRLVVMARGVAAPAFAVTTRSASAAGATRLSQVALIAAAPGEEHLAYSVGNCGAVVCGRHEVVVVGAPEGTVRELLRARLGRAGGFEVSEGGMVLLEPFVAPGVSTASGLSALTYAWDGRSYALRDVAVRPTPTPSSSPPPR